MERIKRAIEKANKGKKVEADSPFKDRTIVESAVDRGDELERINYSNTRIVELDPAVLEENRIVAHNKTDLRSGAFDLLRTKVIRTMKEKGWQTLAITSPRAECGKTTVAINLAMSLAHQTSQTVLLADFDLRRPRMAEYLGLKLEKSLIDYIEGGVSVEEVLVNPGIPRLVLLPNQGSVANAAEVLTNTRTRNLVTEIKSRYESRIIIFDLPPLLATDDAMAFLPEVDCVLLVAGNGSTTTSEVEESMRMLKSSELLGTVLNKAEEQADKPYY